MLFQCTFLLPNRFYEHYDHSIYQRNDCFHLLFSSSPLCKKNKTNEMFSTSHNLRIAAGMINVYLIEKIFATFKYKPRTMRQNGSLGVGKMNLVDNIFAFVTIRG